jgi:excisionase family DNA binding protein
MHTVLAESNDELRAIDAARRLGIDLNRLYVLLRLGRLNGHKLGGEWRVSRVAVEERLRTRERRQPLAG